MSCFSAELVVSGVEEGPEGGSRRGKWVPEDSEPRQKTKASSRRLPAAFAAQFPGGVEIAYAVIPLIPHLEPELRTEVQVAFAGAMAVVWKAMAGIAAGGLVTVFFLKEIPMHTATDTRFGLEQPLGSQEDVDGDAAKLSDSSSQGVKEMSGV